MTIILNGVSTEISCNTEDYSLSALLDSLGFTGRPVVVEHNREAIFPRDYESILVKNGDLLEIISIAAGG